MLRRAWMKSVRGKPPSATVALAADTGNVREMETAGTGL